MKAKELVEAILNRDIETLKELRNRAKPVVIAFSSPGQAPVSYYVSGVGFFSPEEYQEYLNSSNSERRQR